ncbi:MAG TPA: thiamine pyrophosphate-binding protein, partial [Candidatus Saccharimonadales bacterium]|nr:thiamine pyrophosphate-binding protein [Candidatus Saccharimonadales bacterium]
MTDSPSVGDLGPRPEEDVVPTPEIEPEVSGAPETPAVEASADGMGSAGAVVVAEETEAVIDPETAIEPPATAGQVPEAAPEGDHAAAEHEAEPAAEHEAAPEPAEAAAQPTTVTEPAEPAPATAPAEPAAEASAEPTAATEPAEPAPEASAEPTAATAPAEPTTATEPAEPAPAEPAAATAPPSSPSPAPEPVARITVSRHVARAFRAAGVRLAFTVPGESFLGLLEALPAEGIRVVTARHENGAGFMAEAYGQLTGRPAVALVTRAVGAANLAIAVHTARADSSPMVAIVGQVERRFRGREAFQEVDVAGTFGGLAKWSTEVGDPSSVPSAIETALRELRTGRPGPVLLALPEDLFDQSVPDAPPPPFRPRTIDIDPSDVRDVLSLLAGARRPVILAGAGVLRARATADLVALAEMLEVPVVSSWRRPDVFPNDHRLYLGMAGHGSAPSVRERLRSADALLVIGCRLNEVTSFGYTIPARRQRWAHVDLEPLHNMAGVPASRPAVAADSRVFLRSAVQRLRLGVLEAAPLDARREANVRDREAYEQGSIVDAQPWDGPGVHPGRVIATLQRLLGPDSIVTTDAGNFASWAG